MMRISLVSRMSVLIIGVLSLALPSRPQTVVTINYPGAVYSSALGINNNNVIVGAYTASGNPGTFQGFLLSGGTYSTIQYPSASVTYPLGINDAGSVVGSYYDQTTNQSYGFLLSSGSYSSISFPGAINTLVYGINNLGQVVGYYYAADGSEHGFELSQGIYSTIDCPCGQTFPQAINNAGAIVGYYVDSNNIEHGLEYNSGVFTTLDYPGAANTVISGINDTGTFAGFWATDSSSAGAFTGSNGQYSPIVIPPPATNVGFLAINDSGQIVGEAYGGTPFTEFGFLLSPGPFGYVPISNGNVVSVFDVSTYLPVTTIPVGTGPFDAAVSPNGSFVYVDNSGSSTVSVINPTNNTVVATIPIGPAGSVPAGIAVTPDSSTVYLASHGTNIVSVINAATNSVVATVPVGSYPFLLAITPNGQYVYVPNFESNNVSVISTASNTVIATVPVGEAPQSVAITPDGKSAYITCTSSNLVYVIDTATNTVTQTIPVSNGPLAATISPNGLTTYVSEYSGATTAVINNASNTITASIPVGSTPYGSAITPDGAFLWQTNWSASSVSVISTATNSVVTTIPVSGYDFNVAIGSAPPTSQTITQPLSPTAPNTFNFGPHNFTVQYPAGTNFSGVNMTVTAAQTTQQTFKQRVAGTQFANATCIVYSGEGGNCEDYQVTCSATSGGTITCPSESTPSITVKTSFDTQQQILTPAFLTTPIGTNEWTNIFEAFYLQRIDPTMKGRTKGFSEFVAVDLGATNGQGAGTLTMLDPLKSTDLRIFPLGSTIPVEFTLSSLANPSTPITDASASIAVIQTSDANGNATANVVVDCPDAFRYFGGKYVYSLNTRKFAPGTYNITIYGNAFAATQVQFTLPAATKGVRLVTTVQSVSLDATSNGYQVTVMIQNAGQNVANGVEIVSASLDGKAPVTPLPISLGDIAAGSSVVQTLVYPAFSGKHDNCGLTILESYSGGNSAAGLQITLP
jgi:YVTN family beta-propeller protein